MAVIPTLGRWRQNIFSLRSLLHSKSKAMLDYMRLISKHAHMHALTHALKYNQ